MRNREIRVRRDRCSAIAFLEVWPIFDRLRSEPRFQALLKKMNLE